MATPVAGELYYEIDGQLAEIKRQLRQSAGYPFDPYRLKIVLQDVIEGKFGDMPKKSEKQPASLLSIIATTQFGAVAEKSTNKCFTGSRWAYRDSDFDNWFPANQPMADPCVVSTLAVREDWLFVEAAAAVLGSGAGTDVALLGKLLIERSHTMTLAQAEEMVEKTERGEKTAMRTDGYGNFFFVETGDPENPVSVGYVSRRDRDWRAHVFRLDGVDRWSAGYHLLVRNLDASKL